MPIPASLWSGLETPGMMEAKCSLVIQEDGTFDPRIKSLPKQRVTVYQDKGYNPDASSGSQNGEENFYVNFNGCTILQFEPAPGSPQRTMPITLTVGGRCVFSQENFQDFSVMMRTKQQSREMNIAPNGNFDWPDVESLLLCPLCGKRHQVPQGGDDDDHEYWLLFYPLLQITIMKGSQMTLGTRTICRLTCLHCMEELLKEMTLNVSPSVIDGRRATISFTLPAKEVLSEAGSAAFLEDGPQRPKTHPHVEDILDAWTLYNLWEHSGAWEALQNDYRTVLSRSMHSENNIEQPKANNRTAKSVKNTTFDTNQDKKSKLVTCDTCQKRLPVTDMKKCGGCKKATYCGIDCQKDAWTDHRSACKENTT